MVMRGKLFLILVLILCMFTHVACTPVIRNSADELTLYHWRCEEENGKTADLSFDGDDGCLSVSSGGAELTIRGIYAVTDDSLLICDRSTGSDYRFGYRLYGDRIELSSNGSAITLQKITEG